MARAWVALLGLEVRTGQPYHTVLRLRVEHPELHSPELAERLSAVLGRPITAGGLRQALQRRRDQYVGFLVEEVAGSLESPTADQLERELGDLGLLDQCRPALGGAADPASSWRRRLDPVGERLRHPARRGHLGGRPADVDVTRGAGDEDESPAAGSSVTAPRLGGRAGRESSAGVRTHPANGSGEPRRAGGRCRRGVSRGKSRGEVTCLIRGSADAGRPVSMPDPPPGREASASRWRDYAHGLRGGTRGGQGDTGCRSRTVPRCRPRHLGRRSRSGKPGVRGRENPKVRGPEFTSGPSFV